MKTHTREQLTRAGFKAISFNPPTYVRQEGDRVTVYHREELFVEDFDGERKYLPKGIERMLFGN